MKFLLVVAVTIVATQAAVMPVDDDAIDRLYRDAYMSKFITTCSDTDPCVTPNAQCVKGRCVCQKGFVVFQDYSVSTYSYNYDSYKAEEDSQSVNATGAPAPATDSKNQKIQSISCVPYASYDEPCQTEMQCKATLGTGATCQKFMDGVNGACACSTYSYQEQGGKCVLAKGLGEECDGDLNCKTKNAKCQDLPEDFDGDKSAYSSYAISAKKYGKARSCQCPKEAPFYNSNDESCTEKAE